MKGGPAFPQNGGLEQLESAMPVQGMSLRDYFAAKAMQAMLSNTNYLANLGKAQPAQELVKDAYTFADICLEERAK